MKKMLIITYCLILLLLILATLPNLWMCKVQPCSLELVGTEMGLYLTPADSKLFNIAVMNPGQSVTSKITIKNNNTYPFMLFLRTERVSAAPLLGEPDLFKQIQLTVILRDVILYQGSMYDFANCQDSISLGTFKRNEAEELVVTVYLPGSITGNEYQSKSLNTRWIFIAKTSFCFNFYLYFILGLLLVVAGCFIERNRESRSARKRAQCS